MYGQSRFGTTNNFPPSGPPFVAVSADNGLSVDPVSGRIVIGQIVGQALDPGQLLSAREIPLKGFSFVLGEAGNLRLSVDPTLDTYLLGDISETTSGSRITIDGPNQIFTFRSAARQRMIALQGFNRLYRIGDIDAVNNSSFLSIDDTGLITQFQISAGRRLFLSLAGGVETYTLGDADNIASGLQLQMMASGGNRALFTAVAGDMLDLDQGAGVYTMGDVGLVFNSTRFTVNDSTQEIRARGTNPFAVEGSTTLIRTYTALANAAAAAAATLLNAPVAGDPTKWISINDNGTVRFIPCW